MAKLTNLEMVQNILSSMDSDNVNGISDTEEALQVFEVLQETYFEIISRRRWKTFEKTRLMEQVGDTTKPTKFKIPSQVVRINCFRYQAFKEDTSPQEPAWKELKYLEPCDFIDHVQSRNPVQLGSRIQTTTNDDGVTMYILNDTEPEFWTSFDDRFVYVDNWQSADSTTVTSTRTSVKVTEQPLYPQLDTDTPDLPVGMFPLLLSEAKSTCWLNFKGTPNQKAEQIARRQYIKMREESSKVEDLRTAVNYGKPPSGSRSNSRRGLSYRI
jgi:hypothetical protein